MMRVHVPHAAAGDAAFLRQHGAVVVDGPKRNPFASEVPCLDVLTGLDEFYYQNGWILVIGGQTEAAVE